MSAAKHTPGPWFIFGNGHCVGGANTDPTTMAEHPTAGIAMCGMARREPAECESNARLIAAAPELAQALADLIEAADSMAGTFGCIRGNTPEDADTHTHDQWAEGFLKERADAARAAIAKATGDAS